MVFVTCVWLFSSDAGVRESLKTPKKIFLGRAADQNNCPIFNTFNPYVSGLFLVTSGFNML